MNGRYFEENMWGAGYSKGKVCLVKKKSEMNNGGQGNKAFELFPVRSSFIFSCRFFYCFVSGGLYNLIPINKALALYSE